MGVIAIKIVGGQVVEVITTYERPDVCIMDIDQGDTEPDEFDPGCVLRAGNPVTQMIERHFHPEEEEETA